jgi:hypothetical protein
VRPTTVETVAAGLGAGVTTCACEAKLAATSRRIKTLFIIVIFVGLRIEGAKIGSFD